MKLTVCANAKINLSLDILERLASGYHSLYMIMQSVDLCDEVTVEVVQGSGISLSCSETSVPVDDKNTAYKAARVFFEETGVEAALKIHIKKRIPCAAGLAGGSADAAAVLFALNRLLGTQLNSKQLCALGLRVGADVPFCLTGGTALAQDIGGVLSPLPDLHDCYIVLAKPAVCVCTKDAYSTFDGAWWIKHPKNLQMLNAVVRGNIREISLFCENVFEQVIDVPGRADIKYILREQGALAACMSGSGPTVFGIFEHEEAAVKAAKLIKPLVAEVFITHPSLCGVYIREDFAEV